MTKSPKWEAVAQTMNARAEAMEQSETPRKRGMRAESVG
jgi:hypothetical protein